MPEIDQKLLAEAFPNVANVLFASRRLSNPDVTSSINQSQAELVDKEGI